MSKQRIAFLIELDDKHEFAAVRRLLKRLLRGYGLKCLGIRPAAETKTFGGSPPSDPTNN